MTHPEVEALAQRGEHHRKARRFDEALADFEQALVLEPDNAWLRARRASTRLMLTAREQRLGTSHAMDAEALRARYEPILLELDRALETLPDDLWIRSQRVEALRCLKRLEACRDACSGMLRLQPDLAWAYQQRAWAHRWMLHYDEALADIERARELQPDNLSHALYRALLHGQMRRLDESLAEFERVMSGHPELVEPWSLERGVVHLHAGQLDEALTWFERGMGRADAYFARYLMALARALRDGVAAAHADIASARRAADSMLQTEGRAAGECILAGLSILEGDSESVLPALASALRVHEHLIETALYDPVVRPVVWSEPSLRELITQRLGEDHPVMKYLCIEPPRAVPRLPS
jgi:tetratricopeptide (TPR) repeat protein